MKARIENLALRYQAFITPEILVPVAAVMFALGLMIAKNLL